jgi:hypothetical protein
LGNKKPEQSQPEASIVFRVLLIISTVLGLVYFSFSIKTVAANEEDLMSENPISEDTAGVSATEWEHLYFYGLTKFPTIEVGLKQNMAQGLIGMVSVKASVSTGALIDPKYMLNKKGLTPWLAMHFLLATKQPALLADVSKGTATAFVPNDAIEQVFVNHINWPKELLSQYNIEIEGHNVFILPFLVPKGAEYNLSFDQSMKAPDGSLEIFGVGKFDEKQPEKLLSNIQSTLAFIKENRPDVTGKPQH